MNVDDRRGSPKNILFVAYHFPPLAGSSGWLRSLKFCRYLPEFGWTPTMLTVRPRAYENTSVTQLDHVPRDLRVIRSFALDTQRHLAIGGRYLRLSALPDRWASWTIGAVLSGYREIRKHRIKIIFCTFPIATAVFIGWILHRLSGKPWVVDLRDSMTEDHYPSDPTTWRVWRWLERQAVRRASKIIFTAPSAVRMYLQRYPDLAPQKCLLLPNGYDEQDFRSVQQVSTVPAIAGRPFRLLHTGLVYPQERDPTPLFRALARLKREGKTNEHSLSVEFRAPGYEQQYSKQIEELGISGVVRLLPSVPYAQALAECAAADGLLLLQAANCDHQIPAKAYEYLRLARPILALTTQSGDTGSLLREVGGATIVDLADEKAIYDALPRFMELARMGRHSSPDAEKTRRFERRNQAQILAHQLDLLLAR